MTLAGSPAGPDAGGAQRRVAAMATPPPPASAAGAMAERVRADKLFSLLGLAMWGGTAIKCAPFFSAAQMSQACAGWLVMLLISSIWPTVAYDNYVKWRSAGLAFLQLFLFALPFNFDTAVVNAIAPAPGVGRAAWILDIFQVFMSIRVALLIFTSVGWPLPLHQQMGVQAAKVGLLVIFGTRPYCASVLMSSPEMSAVYATVHKSLALLGTPLMPLASQGAIAPQGEYAQRVAALLLAWLLLGWLLPCLLLLPEAPAGEPPPAQPDRGLAGAAAAAGGWVTRRIESALRLLLPPPGAAAAGGGDAGAPTTLLCVLHWWVLVQVAWAACCVVAQELWPDPGLEPAA